MNGDIQGGGTASEPSCVSASDLFAQDRHPVARLHERVGMPGELVALAVPIVFGLLPDAKSQAVTYVAGGPVIAICALPVSVIFGAVISTPLGVILIDVPPTVRLIACAAVMSLLPASTFNSWLPAETAVDWLP